MELHGLDSQTTLELGRGDSMVEDAQGLLFYGDPILGMASSMQACGHMELPDETCKDMRQFSTQKPGRLSQFMFRNCQTPEPGDAAFECLKWVRIVARFYDCSFETMDPVAGPLAREVHTICSQMLEQESALEVANKQFLARRDLIYSIGGKKKVQERVDFASREGGQDSSDALEKRLLQVDDWVLRKLKEAEVIRLDVRSKLDLLIDQFMHNITEMMRVGREEFDKQQGIDPGSSDAQALLADLESQLEQMTLAETLRDDAATSPPTTTGVPSAPNSSKACKLVNLHTWQYS